MFTCAKFAALLVVTLACTGCSLLVRDNPSSADAGASVDAAQPRQWRRLTDLPRQPSALSSAPMVYMPGVGAVLYGGNRGAAPSDSDPSDEMWVWDGERWSSPCNPLESLCPIGRLSGHSMVYDEVGQRLLLFGGVHVPDGASSKLWEYTSEEGWNEIVPIGPGPSPRFEAAMAYDRRRNAVVLFGGRISGSFLGDAWEFRNGAWMEITPAPGLTARGPGHSAAAFAESLGSVVIYGGAQGGGSPSDELWSWDGERWLRQCENCTGAGRSNPALVYDTTRDELLLIGGRDVDGDELAGTWVFDPDAFAFDVLDSNNLPARTSLGATYDPNADAVFAFGGMGPACTGNLLNCDETWVFSN